jgi:hypothetical protein
MSKLMANRNRKAPILRDTLSPSWLDLLLFNKGKNISITHEIGEKENQKDNK